PHKTHLRLALGDGVHVAQHLAAAGVARAVLGRLVDLELDPLARDGRADDVAPRGGRGRGRGRCGPFPFSLLLLPALLLLLPFLFFALALLLLPALLAAPLGVAAAERRGRRRRRVVAPAARQLRGGVRVIARRAVARREDHAGTWAGISCRGLEGRHA
ncbi:unnamed protein product, partial [Pelagomonas calceolata]